VLSSRDLLDIFCFYDQISAVSSTIKAYHHDIAEILLKVALSTIKQTNKNTTIIKQGYNISIIHAVVDRFSDVIIIQF
jgi:hypothetical protein